MPNLRIVRHKNRPTLHKKRPYPQSLRLIFKGNGWFCLLVGGSRFTKNMTDGPVMFTCNDAANSLSH
ncbi:protein of unknown function (plasmid) [Caballeronia sp. S22]